MSEIKVGQVWRKQDADNIVVTKIDTYLDVDFYSYVYPDGTCVSEDEKYFITKGRKLLAEYSTWQEAVNSPEFLGIYSDSNKTAKKEVESGDKEITWDELVSEIEKIKSNKIDIIKGFNYSSSYIELFLQYGKAQFSEDGYFVYGEFGEEGTTLKENLTPTQMLQLIKILGV